ncbi:hypothetical protein [Vibrio crassostreae]|uniref:hypothetical protein n=1 Tax=Vibrio crassostreae TaxID=246167 RepID=UPI001B300EC6|nr:hypothetical protein [Vibrio crassostreae]
MSLVLDNEVFLELFGAVMEFGKPVLAALGGAVASKVASRNKLKRVLKMYSFALRDLRFFYDLESRHCERHSETGQSLKLTMRKEVAQFGENGVYELSKKLPLSRIASEEKRYMLNESEVDASLIEKLTKKIGV